MTDEDRIVEIAEQTATDLGKHLRAVRLDERRACLEATKRTLYVNETPERAIHARGCPYEGGCGLCPEGPSDAS